MRYFAHLINLKDLDLECCPRIHGGLIHLKGLIFTSIPHIASNPGNKIVVTFAEVLTRYKC
jgi:hypothetical protein